jgi:hypothetical protein
VPRFRIASGDGNFVLFAVDQTPVTDQRRSVRFIKSFMLWTLTRWFVMSQKTSESESVASCLIVRDLRLAFRRQTVPRGGAGFAHRMAR